MKLDKFYIYLFFALLCMEGKIEAAEKRRNRIKMREDIKITTEDREHNISEQQAKDISEIALDEVRRTIENSKKNFMYDYITGFLKVFVTGYKRQVIFQEVKNVYSKGSCSAKELERYKNEGKFNQSQYLKETQKAIANRLSGNNQAVSHEYQEVTSEDKKKLETSLVSTLMDACYEERAKNLNIIENLKEEKSNLEKGVYKQSLDKIKEYDKKRSSLESKLKEAYWYVGSAILDRRNQRGLEKQTVKKWFSDYGRKQLEELKNDLHFFKNDEIKQIIKIKNLDKRINKFDAFIEENKLEIKRLDDTIFNDQAIVYTYKKKMNEIDNQIKGYEKLSKIDCVKFGIDPNSGYELGKLRKTFQRIPFLIKILGCGKNSELFSDDIKNYYEKIEGLLEKNTDLLFNIIAKESLELIKTALIRTIKGVYYLVKYGSSIIQYRQKCLFKGMEECGYYKGRISGYGLRIGLALVGM